MWEIVLWYAREFITCILIVALWVVRAEKVCVCVGGGGWALQWYSTVTISMSWASGIWGHMLHPQKSLEIIRLSLATTHKSSHQHQFFINFDDKQSGTYCTAYSVMYLLYPTVNFQNSRIIQGLGHIFGYKNILFGDGCIWFPFSLATSAQNVWVVTWEGEHTWISRCPYV